MSLASSVLTCFNHWFWFTQQENRRVFFKAVMNYWKIGKVFICQKTKREKQTPNHFIMTVI